jgi:hypothetical protein
MSAGHIAAQAAEQNRIREEEEELMTGYTPSDLNDPWEFKIVRSHTNAFGKPEVFQKVVQEESLSGWELLEKLGDDRVRFKRPTSARRRDGMLPRGVDPYRTRYGIGEGAIVMWVLAVMALVFGVVIAIGVMSG